MVLVGLIFIVVGFNIFHSLKRSVYEKIEEIATPKALGAAPSAIRNIFLVEGLIIGIAGCAMGLTLGLFISNNINEFFRLIEAVINNLIFAPIEAVVRLFNESFELEPVYIFSSNVFYIDRIESTVFWYEAFFVNFFALFCSLSASYFASRKVAFVKPVEVLRYE
jgi:lipoprotein-releasing system permease protein